MSTRIDIEPLPDFVAEEIERDFCEKHDTAEFVDSSRTVLAEFPNLQPSTHPSSVRHPDADRRRT